MVEIFSIGTMGYHSNFYKMVWFLIITSILGGCSISPTSTSTQCNSNNQPTSIPNGDISKLAEGTSIIEKAYTYTYWLIDEWWLEEIMPGDSVVYSYQGKWLFVPLSQATTIQVDGEEYYFLQKNNMTKTDNYMFYAAVKYKYNTEEYWHIEQEEICDLSEIKYVGISDLQLCKEVMFLAPLMENDAIDVLLVFIRNGLDNFYTTEIADIYIGRYEEQEDYIIMSVAIITKDRSFWDVFSVNLSEDKSYYVFKPPMTDGAPFMENNGGDYSDLIQKTITLNRFHVTI